MKSQLGGAVRKIPLPPESQALSMLPRVDYTDCFLIRTDRVAEHSAEQWARLILDDAPPFWRHRLPGGWHTLGLEHVPVGTPDSVLGWPIALNTPDDVLLHGDGRRGISGDLLVERRDDGVLFATMVQHHHRLAAIEWAAITPTHQLIVARLLKHASLAAGSVSRTG